MTHIRTILKICGFAALLLSAAVASAGQSRTDSGDWARSRPAMDVWTQDLNYYVLGDNRINQAFLLGGSRDRQQALYAGLEQLALGQSVDAASLAANSGLQLTITEYNAMIEDGYLACEASRTPYPVCNRIVAALAPFERAVVTR